MKILRHGKAVEAGAPPCVARRAALISDILTDVCDLPDRTSPDDQPDLLQVTTAELTAILENLLPLPEPAPDPRLSADPPPSGVSLAEVAAGALGEIERLRTFVRSARAIVQAYARANPKHVLNAHEQDPMGAHAWLAAESAEVGTMRDGGDPRVVRT